MKILFHIFGLPISFLGFMTTVGVLIGIFVARGEIKRKHLNLEKLYDLALYSVIAGMIGARLFFIVFYNLNYYIENPIKIFNISEGGMSIHGGLLGAFTVSIIYVKRHHLNYFKYADAVAPAIILGQGIGRIGCDVFGRAMNKPLLWGVDYHGQLLHPVQVYEFVLNYIVFFILWRMRKNIKYDGQLFLLYIILFSLNRSIVELFRINPSIIGWFSISHLLSLVFILGSIIVMHFVKKKPFTTIDNHVLTIKERKIELIKDIFILIALILISLFIFYAIQG